MEIDGKMPPLFLGYGFARSRQRTRPKAEFVCALEIERDVLACATARLALGELESLAGALLTVLLALVRARIAPQQSHLLQLRPQLGIEFEQGASNAQPRGAGLSRRSSASGENKNIELVGHL